MPARRRAVAACVCLAICASLHVATWKPLAVQAAPAPGVITTYAGGATSGPGTSLGQAPWGLAVAGATLYIVDADNSVVRALNTGTGTETIVAGNGTSGDSGLGGLATDAELNSPQGVAVDSTGNLFIGTFGRVQRVDHSTGIITAFAGTGLPGYGGDGGLATAAQVNYVQGLAIDSADNVFLSDPYNNRVRKVDHATGIITTVAGTGVAGLSGDTGLATSAKLNFPIGLSIDGSGNIFVADTSNNRIREISSGIINTVAGSTQGFSGDGGAATSAKLFLPRGVAVDGSSNLWISDTANSRIREVVAGTINTVVGTGGVGSGGDGGPATAAQLNSPFGAIVDGSGSLFIADYFAKRVRKVSSGTITTAAGNGTQCSRSGDGGAATAATLCNPWGLAVDSSGDLFIVDQGNQVVREVNSGGIISKFAGDGTQGSSGDGGSATAAQLSNPTAAAVDGSGNVYIADTGNNVVRKVAGGTITLFAGNYTAGLSGDGGAANAAQLSRPTGLAFDSGGNLYIADAGNYRIRKVTPGGVISTFAGTNYGNSGDGGPATSAQLQNPFSVAVDGAGVVYINDYDIGNIRKVDLGGTISVAAVGLARNIAAGPGNRIIAASDFTQHVYLMSGGGLVPIAGTGSTGFSGDGGLATAAELYYPIAVAVDSAGTIFIADLHNQRIRRVQAFQNPTVPQSVSASPAAYSVRVKWKAPASSGGLPITSYTVTPSAGSPVTVSGSPPPLTATISGLSLTTSYTFTVSAATVWGSSPDSPPTNSVTPLVVATGEITTNAGSVGNGPALSLGQVPYSVAMAGSHLYVGDVGNPVVRDVNLISGNESALAGNDSYGYSGNGGPAVSAMVYGAGAVVYCDDGNTYIADTSNYVIRKIDGSGVISTVAGTGHGGFSGDGGPATNAQLSRVLGLACRTGGGLYISDSDNGRVRILDGSGNIATWWYGFGFPTGIVETGGQNQVDVSDTAANKVWALTDFSATRIAGSATGAAGSGGDGGPATSAQLHAPSGLAYAPDYLHLYIADTLNHKVREVSGGTITTLAGTGVAGFTDSVSASSAQFNEPTGITVIPHVFFNTESTVYVADTLNYRVRKIDPSSGFPVVTSAAGNGTPSLSGDGGQATAAQLGNPYAIAFDAAGNEYVADNQNAVIRKITPAGVISTFAGTGVSGYSGDGGAATSAKLNDPRGVAVNAAGDVFISDAGNQIIRKVDHSSGNITRVAGTVATAGFSGDNGVGTNALVSSPTALAVDGSGNLYIADTGNNRVRMLTPGGTISTFAGTGVAGFGGDSGVATSAQLNGPRGLAVDGSGNVVIADTLNNRVRKVYPAGNIVTIAGNGQFGLAGDLHPGVLAKLASPHGVAFDSSGNVFVADTGNQRIRVIDTHGIITSVVGVCGIVAAFSGDDGPAGIAHVNTPFGLATDAQGNVYIADINSNRVRVASITPPSHGSSCQGAAGNPASRSGVNGSPGQPPGVRLPQYGPGSRLPVSSKAHAGTAIPARPTRALPHRSSASTKAAGGKTSGGSKAPAGQTAPSAAVNGAQEAVPVALRVQPTGSNGVDPLGYVALLLPLGVLLLVALAALSRRQHRE